MALSSVAAHLSVQEGRSPYCDLFALIPAGSDATDTGGRSSSDGQTKGEAANSTRKGRPQRARFDEGGEATASGDPGCPR